MALDEDALSTATSELARRLLLDSEEEDAAADEEEAEYPKELSSLL